MLKRNNNNDKGCWSDPRLAHSFSEALAKRFQHFVQHPRTLLNDVEIRDGQTHSAYSTVNKININV